MSDREILEQYEQEEIEQQELQEGRAYSPKVNLPNLQQIDYIENEKINNRKGE